MTKPIYGKPKELPLSKAACVKNTGEELNHIRFLRKPLLKAFDVYKSNVYYGVVKETEAEHAAVLAWYKNLCDLKTEAVESVPAAVQKYLEAHK